MNIANQIKIITLLIVKYDLIQFDGVVMNLTSIYDMDSNSPVLPILLNKLSDKVIKAIEQSIGMGE